MHNTIFFCAVIHIVLHGIKQLFERVCKAVDGNEEFFVRITANKNNLIVFDVLRTDFKTNGYALHLPLVELPTRALVAVVEFNANTCIGKHFLQLICLVENAGLMLCNGQYDELHGRNARREHKPAVVAVSHDKAADHAGADAPARCEAVFMPALAAEISDVICLCKMVAEIMTRSHLQSFSVLHHRLKGIGCFRSRKFLFFALSAADNGNCKHVLHKVTVNFKHTLGFFLCFLGGCVRGVALLPEEFARAQEGAGVLFPSYNVCPLVIEQR